MSSSTALLRRVMLEKSAVLAVASLACAMLQYIVLRRSDLVAPLAIWRLPTNSGAEFCISSVCGGASLLLMFGAPAIGVACSLLYDAFNRERLRKVARSGVIASIDDAIFRLQFAIVIVVVIANGMLGGFLFQLIVGEIRSIVPIIIMQTCILILSYVSATISVLSGYARNPNSTYSL
jgi:hypothetical protein